MERFQSAKSKISASNHRPEVAASVQSFLDSLLPSELAALPPEAEPLLVSDVGQIPQTAVELVKLELLFRGMQEVRDFLHAVSEVYIAAHNRLAQIEARTKWV